MKMLSLFSGIGGIDLAAQWAGIETVCFVEIDKYCQKVLNKHWSNVPIIGDIHDVTTEKLESIGIDWRTIDIIAGGDPCQPDSITGKRMGTKDPRFLWPQMFGVIKIIRPSWVIRENVTNSKNMGLYLVESDLESIGYEIRTFEIPACCVGLPTLERHLWTIASTGSIEQKRSTPESLLWEQTQEQFSRSYKNLPRRWDLSKTRVCGNGERIPNRVDRLKCLGNAVVPQQVYPIFHAIMAINNQITQDLPPKTNDLPVGAI